MRVSTGSLDDGHDVCETQAAYCEAKGLLPEEHYEFGQDRSTTDMMFVGRRLQEMGGRQECLSLCAS